MQYYYANYVTFQCASGTLSADVMSVLVFESCLKGLHFCIKGDSSPNN